MHKVLVLLVLAAGMLGAAQRPLSEKGRERIAKEVRRRLVMLPFYSVFDNFEYKVGDGVVTLGGQVTRPDLKSDAAIAVKDIEGVERVVNDIEVLPPAPADARIRLAAYRAIYGQPPLDRYAIMAVPSIHIIVKGGHLTLEGVVDNEGDRNIAGIRANSVPGVFSVTNHLRVER
jgi:hyperosmotically inducible protein